MEEESKFRTKPIVGINTEKDSEKFRLAVTRAAKRRREFERRQTVFVYNSEIPTPKPVIIPPRVGNGEIDPESSIPSQRSPPRQSPPRRMYPEENKNLFRSRRDQPFVSLNAQGSPDTQVNIKTSKLATVNDLIIQQAQEEEDLDDVVSNYIDDLYNDAVKQSGYAYYRSIFLKGFDSILRILVVVIGIVIGILGRDAAKAEYTESDGEGKVDKTAQLGLAVTILGFSVSGICEIRDQFMFKDRSVTLRRCYQEFNKISHSLKVLKFSEKDPFDLLITISEMEEKLNKIDMDAFDSQIVHVGSPHEFKTNFKLKSTGKPNVVGPENIPIYKTTPVGAPEQSQNLRNTGMTCDDVCDDVCDEIVLDLGDENYEDVETVMKDED
jgi:hypothetical protein